MYSTLAEEFCDRYRKASVFMHRGGGGGGGGAWGGDLIVLFVLGWGID